MALHRVRILHISDLHVHYTDGDGTRWRRQEILEKLKAHLAQIVSEDGPIDMICFTGDVAYEGRADEYKQATSILEDLLNRLELSRERLFVVPGNHDIEREVNKKHWSDLVKKLKPLDQNKVSMWFLGEKRIDAIPPEQRDAVLARSHAYRDWVANGIKRSALLPTAARHPNLGYRASFQPPGCRFEVHVIGLDSAFMCGGDRDKGSLLLTSDQIMLQATKSDQLSLPGFRVALVHHPLSWLADERVALNLLGPRVDLLLRGHVHSPEVSYWADPERMLLQFVAASVFDSEDLDSFPNGCQIIEAHLDDDGRPQKYDLRICSWSPKGRHWFDDGGIYKDATGGRLALFPR